MLQIIRLHIFDQEQNRYENIEYKKTPKGSVVLYKSWVIKTNPFVENEQNHTIDTK